MTIICEKCGKKAQTSKWTPSKWCKPCREQEKRDLRVKDQAIVDGGKCPQCGRALRHNAAILGWWQCEQYGAVNFRKEPSEPSCSFQVIVPVEVPR